MTNISIIGTGYVGLVTGAVFSEWGNNVVCIDNNEVKINLLKKGQIPIYEKGLEELVRRNSENKRLSFSTDIKLGISESELVFICVGTPPEEIINPEDPYMHRANLSYVAKAATEIARYSASSKIVVDKSTVPAGTGKKVEKVLSMYTTKKDTKFDVVSNPEFLREGSAVYDCLHPTRVVIGGKNKDAVKKVASLYTHLNLENKLFKVDLETAEMSKLASNAYLAMSISFINEIARLCDKIGADVSEIAKIMKADPRIGKHAFLTAGLGFGGSCFPKDLAALYSIAKEHGIDSSLLRSILQINETQVDYLLSIVKEEVWSLQNHKFTVLGLAFKGNSDDVRESRALELIHKLLVNGISGIKVYDPLATKKAKDELSKTVGDSISEINFCSSIEEACTDSDVIITATDCLEFKEIDPYKLKAWMGNGGNKPTWVFDGRQIFNPKKMAEAEILFYSIGRTKISSI